MDCKPEGTAAKGKEVHPATRRVKPATPPTALGAAGKSEGIRLRHSEWPWPTSSTGRSQLIVYHFMFGSGWEQGCPSCSFLADHFDGSLVHLANRDVTLAVISRAPLAQIEAFKKRMGWRFK